MCHIDYRFDPFSTGDVVNVDDMWNSWIRNPGKHFIPGSIPAGVLFDVPYDMEVMDLYSLCKHIIDNPYAFDFICSTTRVSNGTF